MKFWNFCIPNSNLDGIPSVPDASKHESRPFCSSTPETLIPLALRQRDQRSLKRDGRMVTLQPDYSDFSFTTNNLRKSRKMRSRSGCVVIRDMQLASDNRLQLRFPDCIGSKICPSKTGGEPMADVANFLQESIRAACDTFESLHELAQPGYPGS